MIWEEGAVAYFKVISCICLKGDYEKSEDSSGVGVTFM